MPHASVATLTLRLAIVLFAVGCHTGGAGPPARPPAASGERVEGAPRGDLPWATFSPETFARAKRERRYVVMDGSAEWCHWCHVMEATTYHDASVRALLDRHFIAVKVDIDSRPDLEERYGDYGWPATIIFSPDAEELGKYRGYIAPEKLTEILTEVVARGTASTEAGADPGRTAGYVVGASRPGPATPLPEEQLLWIKHATELELDEYWDETEGGWGRSQKAPMGWDNAWTLLRAERGDAEAKRKVLFTLEKQSRLIDPVWGGIYQYSAGRDWDHAHFEKLMTFQAPALENYAVAYRLTRDPKHLARARAMLGYVERFMKSPEGGFLASQDADLNAHDRSRPFMEGRDYYELGEKERLARGIPRVDQNEYGRENGLAIGAYAAMYEATADASVLAAAERAARRVLATHATPRGGISHGVQGDGPSKQLFLSDNAAFGWGLMRLYDVTKSEEWLEHARAIADFVLAELGDERGGGLFASTEDPDAVGVFAVRRVPFEDNVMALRMLARLARATGEARYEAKIGRIVRAISTPEEIKARGRMLGDYLLALEETNGVRGASSAPTCSPRD